MTPIAVARMAESRGTRQSRWYRPVMLGVTIVVLTYAFALWQIAFTNAAYLGRVGADLTMYLDATRGWLAGASFYTEATLAGPYLLDGYTVLYPPPTLPLFVAFLVLPTVLFWVLPVGVIAWVVVRHRPAPWAWPLMAGCLAFAPVAVKVVHGNPDLWIAAAVALGTIYGWPAVFVLLKPSLAPFALIGVRHRSWWVALVGLALASLLFLPLWLDYATVLLNARGPLASPLYSLAEVPLMLIPLIAWWAKPSRSPAGYATARGWH